MNINNDTVQNNKKISAGVPQVSHEWCLATK